MQSVFAEGSLAAERHGWAVGAVFEDAGISGAKGRKDRPGLDAVLRAVARREVDLVMAWSVDRLGRSLVDLLATLQDLHAKEVDLYLHQQGLDTSTPSGRAMFGMMGVFAEFERSMIQERVKAGLARARDEGVTLGRPTLENADADSPVQCPLDDRVTHQQRLQLLGNVRFSRAHIGTTIND